MPCTRLREAYMPLERVQALKRGPLCIRDAISLCGQDYADPSKLDVLEKLEIGRVRASIVSTSCGVVGVIRGTSLRDQWGRFNFRFWAVPADGDTRRWHSGFLDYANITYAFFKGKPLAAIAGHSLGAAAAQIVGPSLEVPTIALASPRPLFMDAQPALADLVLNVCRADDLVTRVPFAWMGYKHVGPSIWFTPKSRHEGWDHATRWLFDAVEGAEAGRWCLEKPC
jgi:hypothetical protein